MDGKTKVIIGLASVIVVGGGFWASGYPSAWQAERGYRAIAAASHYRDHRELCDAARSVQQAWAATGNREKTRHWRGRAQVNCLSAALPSG
jgi:hypothetical protein